MGKDYRKKVLKERSKMKLEMLAYWDKIQTRMKWEYLWQCLILKKGTFRMTFPHAVLKRGKYAKDNEEKIIFCAAKNGFSICAEEILSDKSVYYFVKN